MPDYPRGVLPDPVIRDPLSTAELQFVSLRAGLDPASIERFLRDLTEAINELFPKDQSTQIASACVGFSRRFYERFGTAPEGLRRAPFPTGVEDRRADFVVYVLARKEWRLAEFRQRLSHIGVGIIEHVVVDRGFQREDGRELGGFSDGVRNARENRESVVFVDRTRDPNEPLAAANGTYMVSMRVTQDLERWGQLAESQQEQIIGRRKLDGSRLDLASNTPVDQEQEIGQGCPFSSHVAKSGPRGAHRDAVSIFRRGVPFIDLRPDGTVEAGLHFVSFQGSIDQFTTIFDDWMGNPDFPTVGTGKDQLFEQGFAKVTHAGFFFVPAPSEYLCSDFLKPKVEDDRCTGHVAIRKVLVDTMGNSIRAERGGFGFQLFDAVSGLPVGEIFTTDSAGRALSGPALLGQAFILREVVVRGGFTTAADQPITLDRRLMYVEVRNVTVSANPGYGQ